MSAPDDALSDDDLEAASGGFDVGIQIQCPTCGKFNCGKH